MAEHIHYVYGVARPTLPVSSAPAGVDDAPVRLEREGDVAALVSSVDAATYPEGALDERTGDLEWLAPRAMAHDRVLTWASDATAVAPFPLLSLFRDEAGVRAMLRERRDALARALERAAAGREYHLRVFRLDDRLVEHLGELSPRIAEMEQAAERATPGQRYLLGRKLAEERRLELRRVAADVAREVHATLRAVALDCATDPLPRQASEGGGAGVAVLNAAYHVSDSTLDGFRAALTALVERREREGFRFEFTGPWPIYHFVREPGDGE